jgi:hypothetical protein
MKRNLHKISTLVLLVVIVFANPISVLANEGEGEHGLEKEVNGYHVTLSSQNEWVKGENTIVVTIEDRMGIPVSNADVEILIAPKLDKHVDENTHGVEEQSHNSMPGMDMGEPEPEPETSDIPTHDEETLEPVAMTKSHEHGVYTLETHLESSGQHEVQVFFHINGEMLQADFVVDVPGIASKPIVLWGFLVVNIGLIISASVLKKQSITVKGK